VFGSVAALAGFHAVLLWSGLPLLWGRRALALWLLVVMLHAWAARPALASALDAVSPADAAFALFVVPAAGAIFIMGFALLRAMRRRSTLSPGLRQQTAPRPRQRPRSIADLLQRLAPRAPPVAIS
jgi:hypothetical protein